MFFSKHKPEMLIKEILSMINQILWSDLLNVN